jgi:hypothetical protein
LLDTHRRDAFIVKPFHHNGDTETRRAKTSNGSEKLSCDSPRLSDSAVSSSLRIFRPPLAAQVTVRDQQPVRVACEGDGSRAPVAGDVTWVSGPWRSSGDWWTQTAAANREASETRYTREEWDITVETGDGDVLCRLVHDLEEGAWIVEGIYD